MTLLFQLLGCSSILAYLAFVITFWFKAANAHNELVKFQYENVRDAWEKSGEPSGMLGWRAPTRSKSIIKRFFLSNSGFTAFGWVFYTPKWINQFPEAQNILKKLRRYTLAWNIGIMSWVVYFMLVAALFSYLFGIGFLQE